MEQIITLIQRVFVNDDFTILGLLSKALVFVLGVICAEYKMKKCFIIGGCGVAWLCVLY